MRLRRSDDRHHALDAAIGATIDRPLVHRLTAAYQRAEDRKEEFPIKDFQPPWGWRTFRRDIVDYIYGPGAADAGPATLLVAAERAAESMVRCIEAGAADGLELPAFAG